MVEESVLQTALSELEAKLSATYPVVRLILA